MTGLLLAVAPSPSPTPQPQVNPNLGSPGFIGFVFTFVLALALIGLVLSMSRHLRSVNRNARLEAAAQEAAASAGDVPRRDGRGTGSDAVPDAGRDAGAEGRDEPSGSA